MIRAFEASDMHDVLNIWLEASIRAHSFVGKEFWKSKIEDMRETYIPNAETYVYSDGATVKGFFSLDGDRLAAMFVSPDEQGKGIGRRLMEKAKALRKKLTLSVYRENPQSIQFYRKCGFIIVRENVDEHTGHLEILLEYNS